MSVHAALQDGLLASMVPRLSRAAAAELELLQPIVDAILLLPRPDKRLSPLIGADGKFHSAPVYNLLNAGTDTPCDFADFVWKNRAPPKERIQCRMNLLTKTIVDDDICELCSSAAETSDHIILHCPIAQAFWEALHFDVPPSLSVRRIWEMPRPPDVPALHYNVFIQLCCWQIWKHRNDVVFQREQQSLTRLLQTCKEEALLWRCRLPRDDVSVSDAWCSYIGVNM
ncbi:hypothetical protein EJB05_25901, partial [Eragrostis curvula]